MTLLRRFFVVTLLLALPLGRAAQAPLAPAVPADAVLLPASDARFVYEGRFDRSDASGPVIIWQASRVRFGFEGDAVALRFNELKGQVYFDAVVDGRATVVALPENSATQRVPLSGYGPGSHQLLLYKRSEANAGTVRFLGVDLPAGAKLLAGAAPHYARRFLFIGDSITVGACNEDGPEDQWADRRTHNAAKSYAAVTAAAFDADLRNIAVSGMGVVMGWVPQLAGATWDRVYPDPKGPRAPLGDWLPDLVFVNLGENDTSYSAAHGQPFPAAFASEYVALVKAVRSAFPQSTIVLLRGGMGGGATNESLRHAWETAVAELEKGDPHVSHFVFNHWSGMHPRAADDRIMANELIAWLKTQSWVNPR
jgi:lysophospholipase L1-like esterase